MTVAETADDMANFSKKKSNEPRKEYTVLSVSIINYFYPPKFKPSMYY